MIDDVDRENEGDLVAAASLVTPRIATCMLRQASGLLCAAITAERAEQLDLPPMAQVNTALHGTRLHRLDRRRARHHHGASPPTTAPPRYGRSPTRRRPPPTSPGRATSFRWSPIRAVWPHAPATPRRRWSWPRAPGLPAAAAICPVLDDDGGMARRAGLSRLARRLQVPMLHVAQLAS